MEVKNQHFVPRCYLKNFSRDHNQIFVYDKILKKDFSSSISKVATTKYFYDWEEIDIIDGKQHIESALGIIEDKTSIMLNKLIERIESDNFKGFEQEEKSVISKFIFYQLIRTKEARTMIDHGSAVLEKELKLRGFTDEDLKAKGLNYMPDDARLSQLRIILNQTKAIEYIKTLDSFFWMVAKNETNYCFYTSDNPINQHINWEGGFNSKEIFYPLTPKIGLIILSQRGYERFSIYNNRILPVVKKDYVKSFNEDQVFYSGRQIFSIESDFLLAEKMIANNPSLSDTTRPRITIFH